MSATWGVIGASSFSGRVFCAHLRNGGEDVVEISRPEFDLNRNWSALVERLTLARVRYVVNFAALNMVGESWRHAPDYYQTNTIGVARLCDRLLGMPTLERFVQVSTPEVYGNVEQREPLREGCCTHPSTPYAASRAAADAHLLAAFRAFGFPVSFTRTVNVYGPGQQLYRIIPRTVMSALSGRRLQLHGGGVSERAFIHIEDVAAATRRVAEAGRAGETYHIAPERSPVTIRSVVERVCTQLGVPFDRVADDAPERAGKDPVYFLDASKIRAELGWSDRISFGDGLEMTVEWFSENYARLKDVPLDYVHKG